jgi:queuine/archaeosine tRNA-ribosyltransferase
VIIYPAIELKDLIYANRHGWLGALVEAAGGVLLRPEAMLGRVFRSGVPIREYLARRGVPRDLLGRLLLMMDHGIGTDFSDAFGIDKSPRNLVTVYNRLGVDLGVAFDVPVKLQVQAVIDLATVGRTGVNIDSELRGVVREVVESLGQRRTAREVGDWLVKHEGVVRDMSRVSVEVTLRRLGEMLDYAAKLGFNGLVPVVQGLFKEDIEYCAREALRLASQYGREWFVAIGTGGRALGRSDIANIAHAVRAVREYSKKYGLSVRIHLLGWSSPNTLPPTIAGEVYSADSVTPRRRAVEGRIYMVEGGKLVLKPVNRISEGDYACDCPVCRRSDLRRYVLEPTGSRRAHARLAHNTYVLQSFINKSIQSSVAIDEVVRGG